MTGQCGVYGILGLSGLRGATTYLRLLEVCLQSIDGPLAPVYKLTLYLDLQKCFIDNVLLVDLFLSEQLALELFFKEGSRLEIFYPFLSRLCLHDFLGQFCLRLLRLWGPIQSKACFSRQPINQMLGWNVTKGQYGDACSLIADDD